MTTPSKPLPGNQAEFEQAVVNSIAREHPRHAGIIAEQFRLADIVGRTGTSVGCYTDFNVPEAAPRLPDDAEYPLSSASFLLRLDTPLEGLPDWHGEQSKWVSPVPQHMRNSALCGALIIHNQRGLISYLECFSYGADWPTGHYDVWFPEWPESDA